MNPGARRKHGENLFEERPRVDRRAEIAHVAGEDTVELIEQIQPARVVRQAGFLRLSNLVADLPIQPFPSAG